MKTNIKFRMAARCEAAGRSNNEDNFQLDDNLSEENWGFTTDQEVDLGSKGALLVVADGMGGMNAGEVASALAVETIKEWFASDKLTDEVIASSFSIKKYIEKAIVAADSRIKEVGQSEKEKKGMGSTIVLAWIIGERVYVGWCGDSRAYRFNQQEGLQQLSRDHSFVQELIDAGKLKEEFAFDHPDSNIITRSLGDTNTKAKPEIEEFPLRNGDIIMLCSDGLSGVLRDNELEEVISRNTDSMEACRDALWEASKNAGWDDNVTIGICQILAGSHHKIEFQKREIRGENKRRKRKKNLPIYFLFGLALFITVLAAFFVENGIGKKKDQDQEKTQLISSIEELQKKYKDFALYDNFKQELNAILETINGKEFDSHLFDDYCSEISTIETELNTQNESLKKSSLEKIKKHLGYQAGNELIGLQEFLNSSTYIITINDTTKIAQEIDNINREMKERKTIVEELKKEIKSLTKNKNKNPEIMAALKKQQEALDKLHNNKSLSNEDFRENANRIKVEIDSIIAKPNLHELNN